MAWNVLGCVELGEDNAPLYPVATKKGWGVEPLADESVIEKYGFTSLDIYRESGGTFSNVFHSVGNKGDFLVTNKRLIIVFDKVPGNRSMLAPIAVAQAVRQAASNRGQAVVGQIMYSSVSRVSARKQSVGLRNAEPKIRIQSADGTVQPTTPVLVEIQASKAPALADAIVQALVAARRSDTAFADSGDALAEWSRLAATPFVGTAKEFESKTFTPFFPARG